MTGVEVSKRLVGKNLGGARCIQGHQRRYITWLLEQCAPEVDPTAIVTPEALELLAERLMTPLQIQHYLTRVLNRRTGWGKSP